MEKTIELQIPVLLPGVKDEKDECLTRLEESLQNHKGILKAHLKREKTPMDLCLHYDPNLLSISEVQRLAERAGAQILNRYHHDTFQIEGMDCSDCSLTIEHSLRRMEGILSVQVNYPAARLWVEYDARKTNRSAIEKRIKAIGYEVASEGLNSWYQENREVIFSLISGLFVLIGWLGGKFLGIPTAISIGFFLAAYVFGGWDISQHAFHALKERHFDTDLLMVMAAFGAAILGNFAEGALLLFLFSLGHALEERSLNRARRAVSALADLAPKTAFVRRDDVEKEIPVEGLLLQDVVIVRPGERIPVDGLIINGSSGVNQASVTGESLPVDKTSGDQVFAGTINGEGSLEVSVIRLAKDSTLAKVMKMVEEAQAQKSPTQQTVERFSRVFVPAILIATLLVIILPPLFGVSWRDSFMRAMTLLVAASPCALALGTPASILAGVAQAARNGVLVKGGAHLENLGRLEAVAFDKTGTITHGRPEVTDVVVVRNSEQTLVSIAAGLEARSAHPLAQAVVQYAQKRGIIPTKVERFESITGLGLRGVVAGKTILVGNQKLMESENVIMDEPVQRQSLTFQQAGKTLVWVAEDGNLTGLIALADTLRPEASATMKELKDLGIEHTIMLTGDNSRAADTIAQQAGISEFRADLMPEDKLSVIRQLVDQYGKVAMIGDGVNDAPALANATVGIAMGGASTDVALETADVALMGDDLSRLPFAIGLGRATRRIIIQNLAISMGVIAVLVFASLTGLVGIGIAIVFHEGSTLVVVANALRLLAYRG